jgi:hypothetical protein
MTLRSERHPDRNPIANAAAFSLALASMFQAQSLRHRSGNVVSGPSPRMFPNVSRKSPMRKRRGGGSVSPA